MPIAAAKFSSSAVFLAVNSARLIKVAVNFTARFGAGIPIKRI